MSQERARLAGGRTFGALAWSNSRVWNARIHDGRQPISNYAFNPIAEQALGSNQTIVPQRVNAALDFLGKLMSNYGNTAVLAAEIAGSSGIDPSEAWKEAAKRYFVGYPNSEKKACPREAFVGLCAAGMVVGVASDPRPPNVRKPNREYAVKAVELIAIRPELLQESKARIWRTVMSALGEDLKMNHNQQINVVAGLWGAGLINR